MERLEIAILSDMGIPNPYLIEDQDACLNKKRATQRRPTPSPDSPEADHRGRRPCIGARAIVRARARTTRRRLRESLEAVIEESDAGDRPLAREERSMVLNILNFGELKVADIMVPRADIIAVEAEHAAARSRANFPRCAAFAAAGLSRHAR